MFPTISRWFAWNMPSSFLAKGIAVNAAAQQVDIDSRATFIRMFKIEGVAPSPYHNHTL